MNIFENYQTATFRGVAFILMNENTREGRKIASHEFVNSDKRFVEDIGRMPVVFKINGFVFGKPGFVERDALKTALNEKGPGRLVHPVYGSVEVVADPYAVSSSMQRAGRFEFQMTFRAQNSDTEPFVQPSRGVFGDTLVTDQQNILVSPPVILSANPNLPTNSKLASIADEAREVVAANATKEFVQPTDQSFLSTVSATYTEGIDKIRRVAESIEESVLRTAGLKTVGRLLKNPPGFLANPAALFPELSQLYRQISGAGAFSRWVEAAEDFADFFSIDNDTQRKRNVTKANAVLISTYQVNALMNAYQSGVTTNFNTVSELERAEGSLNRISKAVVSSPAELSVVNDPAVKSLLLEMRSTAKNIFTQKEQTTFKVIDLNSNGRSVLQTTYDLYGGLDNLSVIANLNQNVNASSPPGPLQVVEQ